MFAKVQEISEKNDSEKEMGGGIDNDSADVTSAGKSF